MVPAPHVRTRSAAATRPKGWSWPAVSLLLALVGALSVAGVVAGAGANGGSSTLDAARAASAGDPALLRSIPRLLGLQSAQPFCKGDDPDDTVDPPSATAPLSFSAGSEAATASLCPAPTAAARLRPLHGLPQSPRAPPRLV